MKTINIHEAKTHLSRLIEQASNGESFIIAKAGKPMVMLVPLQKSASPKTRTGFLNNTNTFIPDDFDSLGQESILNLFGLNDEISD